MADVKWIKIATDIFDDEKILLIESLPEADSIITIWFKLLCLAGKQNNSGVFLLNDKIAYTDEMLATIFRRKVNTVKMALAAFEEYGMIERIEKVITIPNWDKHQSLDALEKRREYDKNYKRQMRAKQKIIASCQVDSQNDNQVDVNSLDIDIDKNKIKNKNNCCLDNTSSIVGTEREQQQEKKLYAFVSFPNVFAVELEPYIEAYPELNIENEFQKANAWLKTNNKYNMTFEDLQKFISTWLIRAKEKQDQANKYKSDDNGGFEEI